MWDTPPSQRHTPHPHSRYPRHNNNPMEQKHAHTPNQFPGSPRPHRRRYTSTILGRGCGTHPQANKKKDRTCTHQCRHKTGNTSHPNITEEQTHQTHQTDAHKTPWQFRGTSPTGTPPPPPPPSPSPRTGGPAKRSRIQVSTLTQTQAAHENTQPTKRHKHTTHPPTGHIVARDCLTKALNPHWEGDRNDQCQACDAGGTLTECTRCNIVWHASCLQPPLPFPLRTQDAIVCGNACWAELTEELLTRGEPEPTQENNITFV